MPSQFKNIEIQDTGYLTLPSGTSAERPSQPESGMIRYNTDLGETEWYDSDDSEWKSLKDTFPRATGGTVVDTAINGRPYRLHYFTETGTDTLTVTSGGEVEYLVVAGGGSGGGGGGSGGAGGVVSTGLVEASSGSYTVEVGSGGTKTNNDSGVSGNNSSVFGITSAGGGGAPGGPGSPGSDGADNSDFQGGSGTGTTDSYNSNLPYNSGGGAGSAESPPDATANTGGDGGSGISSSITGVLSFYGGGGGGGGHAPKPSGGFGIGGSGGGGDASQIKENDGLNGQPNTGGGGGGAYTGSFGSGGGSGGAGGSGIVIVRYPRDPDATYSQPDRTISSTLPGNFNIIEDGLILNLDAGNPVSYPGSGSTWRDLGQGTDGTISGAGFSVDNGGYFEFDGSNDVVTGQPTNINSLNGSTIMLWYRSTLNHNTHNGPFTVFVGNQFVFVETREGRNFFQIATETKSKNVKASSPQGFLINGAWHHIAVSRDGSGNLTGYIDGNSIAFTQEDIYGSWGNPGTSYWLGVQADGGGIYQYHDCDVAAFEIYSREMSEQEIRHNFNVTRGRFGV